MTHEGRIGNVCTDQQYLKCGICSNLKLCKDTHVWDTNKWGKQEDMIKKIKNGEVEVKSTPTAAEVAVKNFVVAAVMDV